MKIFNYILTLNFFLITVHFYAQEYPRNCKNTNLFEYGIPILRSEDNLNNLFNNFSLLIENGEDVDFLSYEFIGTVKNQRDARKYVNKNFKDLPPFIWVTAFHDNETGFENNPSPSYIRFIEDDQAIDKSEIKEMINTISEEYIHIGDEVFAIDYVIELQKFRHYVFINPTTKKVLLKGNIFGIEIPMTHIEYINEVQKIKTADIKKLLKLINSEQMSNSLLDAMAPALRQQASEKFKSSDQKEKFDQIMEFTTQEMKELSNKLNNELLVTIYDKYFTHEEIKDIILFYESPIGKKMLEKTPEITKELMNTMMTEYMPEFQKKLMNKMQELIE